jgi:hypothetical protein
MVGDAVDYQGGALPMFEDTRLIREENRKHCGRQARGAVLGAVNQMDQVFGEGLLHGRPFVLPFQGNWVMGTPPSPRAMPWAGMLRPLRGKVQGSIGQTIGRCVSPPSRSRTGPASPRRSVCAPGWMFPHCTAD